MKLSGKEPKYKDLFNDRLEMIRLSLIKVICEIDKYIIQIENKIKNK